MVALSELESHVWDEILKTEKSLSVTMPSAKQRKGSLRSSAPSIRRGGAKGGGVRAVAQPQTGREKGVRKDTLLSCLHTMSEPTQMKIKSKIISLIGTHKIIKVA